MNASSFLRSSDEIQRASWNSLTSNSTGSEYSASSRAFSTSSCSGPTTPTKAGAPSRGRNTCTTPSSDICCSASFSFFAFIASVRRTHQSCLHAAGQFARTQPREGNAVAMVRIHIGLDLEHERAHARLRRLDLAQIAFLRARRRREFAGTFQEVADPKITQRAAEIERCQMALAKREIGRAHV